MLSKDGLADWYSKVLLIAVIGVVLALLSLAFWFGYVAGKNNADATSAAICPKKYVCLVGATVVGAENFRNEKIEMGWTKKRIADVHVCDLKLLTSTGESLLFREEFCTEKRAMDFSGEKVTLTIKNSSVISINWIEMAESDQDSTEPLNQPTMLRPIKIRLK